MLKSLYPHIDWKAVRAVGFDMDGTLYDEAEFISQVYEPISIRLSAACGIAAEDIHLLMFRRWLEKGSSYNRIFGEVLERFGVGEPTAEMVIADCLAIFRNFKPSLKLPARVAALLGYMRENFMLFLISDGSEALQLTKVRALGLERWFLPGNMGISGCYGPGFSKPATRIIDKIAVLHAIKPAEVVFFGDRELDEHFAAAAGFHYIGVACLIPTIR
jgi:FMN phosphatase YigB (HAD superfamily)